MPTILHIQHMVCDRCIRTVQRVLTAQGLTVNHVALGQAEVDGYDPAQKTAVEAALEAEGFALLEDPQSRIVEQIKLLVLDLIRNGGLPELKVNLSIYLAEKLERSYDSLSSLFRRAEGMTLERWVILQKVELAKELLAYGEVPLADIAYRLGYSSASHLSNQFKQVTGVRPADFRAWKQLARKPLDHV